MVLGGRGPQKHYRNVMSVVQAVSALRVAATFPSFCSHFPRRHLNSSCWCEVTRLTVEKASERVALLGVLVSALPILVRHLILRFLFAT